MKKLAYSGTILVIIVFSFLVGSWTARQDKAERDSSLPESMPPTQHGGEGAGEPVDLKPGAVHISPRRQQTVGVRTGEVEKKPTDHTLRVLGRVEADEVRIYRIVASVDGWIQEAYDNSVGTLVKKNEVLGTFYSPQFLDAEQAYVYALDAVDRLKQERRLELGRQEFPAQIALDQLNVQRQIDILRGFGMSDAQLEEIGRTRKISLRIHITSPAGGFVTARNVSPWQRFVKGTQLFEITDLSRVWILADVFEQDVQYFKPGTKARVSIPYQKKTYAAAVTEVLPIFDAETRTLQVRLETSNPGYILKPDMFADVELPVRLEPAVTVPADAILYSGRKATVFVERGEGYFEPRPVETGWRLGDRVEIVEGLEPGERIVLSGNFLIDSESRLQAVALGIYGDMGIDPVCGMEVDQARAGAMGLTSEYQGKTYYFCSAECKAEFDADPARYVERPPDRKPAPGPASHPGA